MLKSKSLFIISIFLFFSTFKTLDIKALSTSNAVDNTENIVVSSTAKNTYNNFSIEDFSYNITLEEYELMTRVVYAESNAEPYDGKVAVASVILNRLLDCHFPNTIQGVIGQKNAFTCVSNGAINKIPDETSYNAVRDAISGKDPSNDALFFYNPKISTSSWMLSIQKSNAVAIGQHVFFNALT